MSTIDLTNDSAELLALRAAGDDEVVRKEALARLYQLHVDKTYGLAMYLLRDHYAAEDLAQDVWCAMPKTIRRFSDQGAGSFSKWLTRVTRNAVVDSTRRQRSRFPLLTENQLELGQEQAASDLSQEERYERSVAAKAVRDAVRDLGERQRRCVILRFFLEMSVTETARELGMNDNSVKQLQYRGVSALRKPLASTLGRVTPRASEPLIVDTTCPSQRAPRDERGADRT